MDDTFMLSMPTKASSVALESLQEWYENIVDNGDIEEVLDRTSETYANKQPLILWEGMAWIAYKKGVSMAEAQDIFFEIIAKLQ